MANTLWLLVEPHTAFARVRVLQPERVWTAQLEHSRDVLAQLAAIDALAAMAPLSAAGVNALKACLLSPTNFCRCAHVGIVCVAVCVVVFLEPMLACPG